MFVKMRRGGVDVTLLSGDAAADNKGCGCHCPETAVRAELNRRGGGTSEVSADLRLGRETVRNGHREEVNSGPWAFMAIRK